jgi:hypothetical protein
MVVTHSSQTLGNNFVTHCVFFFLGSWCVRRRRGAIWCSVRLSRGVLREREAGFVCRQRQPHGYLQRAVGSLQIDFSAPYSCCYCTFLCYSAYVRTLHTEQHDSS